MLKFARPMAAMVALAACANTTPQQVETTPSQGAAVSVRVSDAAHVKGCKFLGSITKSRYSGMLFAGSGLHKAQRYVLEAAAHMGATDVVWGSMTAGGPVQTASGSAYRCPK